jgi:hypothetical protein
MNGLLLTYRDQDRNRFGPCVDEILRAEGLNWFDVRDFSEQDPEALSDYDIVILTPCMLCQEEIQVLLDYCQAGGRLLCLRPSLRLGQALGLEPTYTAQKGGYARISERAPAGQGLCKRSIQIHGMVDHWHVPTDSEYVVYAALEEVRGEANGFPSVILGNIGAGRTAVFAYDLGATVISIRQGDPDRANTLSAGLDGVYRPSEMFVGHLDPDCADIPQADVHTALLASVIDALIESPMPRLWYYPEPAQRSVVIMTSDGDWSKIEEFRELITAVEERSGRVTFYLVPSTRVTRELADAWSERGHVISVHPDVSSLPQPVKDYRAYSVDEQYHLVHDMLVTSIHAHKERFGVPVRTVRNHAVRWRGYIDAAKDLAELGVEMDFNYVSVAPFSATYMTGSGRPMKLIEKNGEAIDVFQQSTLYSEDLMLEPTFVFSLKWSTDHAIRHVKGMLAENLKHYYTPIGVNSHPVSFVSYSREFVEGFLDMAQAHGVPIVTGESWNDFTRNRYNAHIADIVSNETTLFFALTAPRSDGPLTVMWPLADRKMKSITVDGQSQDVDEMTLWGRRFAFVRLQPTDGRCEVTATFATPPNLSR